MNPGTRTPILLALILALASTVSVGSVQAADEALTQAAASAPDSPGKFMGSELVPSSTAPAEKTADGEPSANTEIVESATAEPKEEPKEASLIHPEEPKTTPLVEAKAAPRKTPAKVQVTKNDPAVSCTRTEAKKVSTRDTLTITNYTCSFRDTSGNLNEVTVEINSNNPDGRITHPFMPKNQFLISMDAKPGIYCIAKDLGTSNQALSNSEMNKVISYISRFKPEKVKEEQLLQMNAEFSKICTAKFSKIGDQKLTDLTREIGTLNLREVIDSALPDLRSPVLKNPEIVQKYLDDKEVATEAPRAIPALNREPAATEKQENPAKKNEI